MSVIDGTLRVGPAGMQGADSFSPVEFVDKDAGVSVCSTSTASNREGYYLSFLKNSAGNFFKAGAIAWTVADGNTTNGYACWNAHATGYVGGTTFDYFGYAFWPNHGAAVFPDGVEANFAPGDKVFKVYGDIVAQAKFGCNGASAQGAVVANGTLARIEQALKANGIMS